MKTPFSTEQFLAVFENYNTAVFPAQIILFLSGLAALFLIFSHYRLKGRTIAMILSVLWLWNGLVYQYMFFSPINKAAVFFAVLFSIEGIFILYEGLMRKRLNFSFRQLPMNYAGTFFILYGLLIYPVIDLVSGHDLAGIISPGLPCPTTIMTLGFFLLTGRSFPRYLLIIPLLWALVGISAALNFGIYQDFIMLLAAIVAFVYLRAKSRRHIPAS